MDRGTSPTPVHSRNHLSACPGSPLYEKVHKQVCQEIAHGNYIVTTEKPKLISPLAAIPKDDNTVRLIHDASFPSGQALNDYATLTEKHTFETVDSVAEALTPGCFMAKLDLSSAYRSVPISPECYDFTGLEFCVNGEPRYMFDSKLCFGSKLAPGIFHKLSQAVKHMMVARGFKKVFAYLDDFCIVTDTAAESHEALRVLISLLRRLGFMVNYRKTVDSCNKLTFLGIELDSLNMCMRLPQKKIIALQNELDCFIKRNRVSLKQLQRLSGRLAFSARVIYGGRVYLRSIYDTISKMSSKGARTKLTGPLLRDLTWWHTMMQTYNGKPVLINKQLIYGLQTDACMTGAGAFFQNDWIYCNWQLDWPVATDLHINLKETLSIIISAHRWAPVWAGKRIIVQSDNLTTRANINRGHCKHPYVMKCLQYLFHLSVMWDFRISCVYIRGKANYLADAISRLHEPVMYKTMLDYLQPNTSLGLNISNESLMFLISRHSETWPPPDVGQSSGLLQVASPVSSNQANLFQPA